jgi:WD40 repeat protein
MAMATLLTMRNGRCAAWSALLGFLVVAGPLRGAVTYQDTVRPLFQSSCLNCHNPDKQKAGLDLSTYESTMDGSDNGKVVEPGDPDKSLLLKVLTHDTEPFMPKGGDKLPDSQIDQIRQWIQANAPEKTGGAVAKGGNAPAPVAVVPVEEKPAGPAAMPANGVLEPFIHTIRAGAVPSVAASPWAPLVALAGQKQVLLYNTDTLDLAAVLPFPEGFPQIVRFSHNGSLLIAGGGVGAKLGHVVIWDVITGKRIAEVGDEFDTVIAADISPDQSLVALGGPSRLVKIFNASTGKMLCKMKKHTDWVTALCFTPDGKELISGDRAGGLSVWDTQGHEIQSVTAHAGEITGIACRGNFVATSSEDGTVKFWDIMDGRQIKSWKAHPSGVRSVSFTQDGHILTSGRDKLVRLWDANGTMVRQFDPLSDIAMQATSAGDRVIAADWNGLVRVWTEDGKRAGDIDSNPPTIAQRIDGLNKRLAALQTLQPTAHAATVKAAADLAAILAGQSAPMTAFNSAKSALAAARGKEAMLQKRCTDSSAAMQAAREQVSGFRMIAGELAQASGANPLLQPAVFSAVAFQGLSARSFADQQAALRNYEAALPAAHRESVAMAADAAGKARANAGLLASVKAAQAALAKAQAAEQNEAREYKTDSADLAKWKAIAGRMGPTPQYASGNPAGE